jgi:tetratricopeptide (TPR) repeat protein
LKSRTKTIVFLLGLGIALFLITYRITRAYRAMQEELAQRWYQRGESALENSQASAAIVDFRAALLYRRDDDQYQLKLAEALAQTGEVNEARAYLSNLWDAQPGNAVLNLELARLAVRQNHQEEALRFYHGAIYGLWPDDPAQHRNTVRLEMARFLAAHGALQQADAALIQLQAESPNTSDAHLELANEFVNVHDSSRALEEYRRAAQLDPANSAAWAGAGNLAFQQGQYAKARDYLGRAVLTGSTDVSVAHTLSVTEAVLELDPYLPGLSPDQRRARLLRALDHAGVRLRQCAAANGDQLSAPRVASQRKTGSAANPQLNEMRDRYRRWQEFKAQVAARRGAADATETVMKFVYQIEQDAGPECGLSDSADTALILIEHRHESAAA